MPWPTERDTEVFDIIDREVERQNTGIQLIASENFTSPAVMEAVGSVLTNKYSEGYPGKRYYGGNEYIDEVEDVARGTGQGAVRRRSAPTCNPTPERMPTSVCTSPCSRRVTRSWACRLDHGGHLTHGSPVNISGRFYNFVSYGLTQSDERLDIDHLRDLAHAHRPRMIVAGATAYSRIIDPEPIRAICDEVGALFFFDAAHIAGLIAGGAHPNPVPYADVVSFTTHKTLRGPRGGCIVSRSEHAKAIDKAIFPGLQGGPLEHVIAGKAVAFKEAAEPGFADYAAQIVRNARALADGLGREGFRLVSGGTDNHLMLVDLRPFNEELTGKDAQIALDRAGITLNKNTVPDDPRSPFVTSGVRIGTPSVTTQGMAEPEMAEIASLITRVLADPTDESRVGRGAGGRPHPVLEVPGLLSLRSRSPSLAVARLRPRRRA